MEPGNRGPAAFPGRVVKITPQGRLYVLGAILLASLTICSRNFSRTGESAFMIPLMVAGVAYLFAIREFLSTPKFPRCLIIGGLLLAALWHVLFLRMPSGFDDDIHRYVWDGRLQRLLGAKMTDEEVLEEFFLGALSRWPTPDEQRAFREYRKRAPDRRAAFADALWGLVNTREFILNH